MVYAGAIGGEPLVQGKLPQAEGVAQAGPLALAPDRDRELAVGRGEGLVGDQVGVRVAETQALAWPRADGYRAWTTPLLDADGFDIATTTVPTRVKNACLEAALLALTGSTLEPSLARGGAVKQESVGPISVTYMDGASAVDRYTVIDGLLRGLVKSTPGASSGNVRLERA